MGAREQRPDDAARAPTAPLRTIARTWTWLGCVGFGGPPAHVALLRRECVERRRWLRADEFEDAIAATNLLPGPGSTQLAIFCAWRVGGWRGALVGGAGFVLPGLLAILLLCAVFLADAPPDWVRGAGAGAGAAVAAVAVQAASGLLGPSWVRARAAARSARVRWGLYVLAGGVAAALAGPWTVLVLMGAGALELVAARAADGSERPPPGRRGDHPGSPDDAPLPPATEGRAGLHAWPVLPGLIATATAAGGVGALVWTAFKVGALSYGGGFVIIPLMQGDAVGQHHWMTDTQFASGVALGQVTPGPVVHTVATVGYAARGVGGALLAAAVAFAPSFVAVLVGARHFDRLRSDARVRAFLAGAGPAAVGAILGAAVPLAATLSERWQAIVLGAAAVLLLGVRLGVVPVLLLAGAAGGLVGAAGGPLPG